MTDKQDPITHAARLLREAAEELRQAHAYNNSEGWENETDAKAAYDEHMAAAQALEDWEAAVGAGGVNGPLMGCAPEGMVMVPKEPTHHMLYAAASAYKDARQSLGAYNAPWAAYRAMLEVAPNPPTSAEGAEHG